MRAERPCLSRTASLRRVCSALSWSRQRASSPAVRPRSCSRTTRTSSRAAAFASSSEIRGSSRGMRVFPRRRWHACWSHPSRCPARDAGNGSARKPEDALRDDVALDLRGAAHDRLGARVEELSRHGAGGERVRAVLQPAIRTEEAERKILQPLVGLASEDLLERALGARMSGAQQGGEAAVAAEAEDLHLDVRL